MAASERQWPEQALRDAVLAGDDAAYEIDVHLLDPSRSLKSSKITLKVERVSLAAALQLLEDMMPGYRFVVREYGLLLAPERQLPPGALPLADFRRGEKEAHKTKGRQGEENVDPPMGRATERPR